MGLKDFLITSENVKVTNPTFLRRSLKRLKQVSKRHSKRTILSKKVYEFNQDGTPVLTKTGKHKYHLTLSNNCKKSQRRLTMLHYKVSCQRKDFLHKQSYILANNQSFNCFAVETLRVKNMIKNRKLSRAISDVSWSSFITMLEYKLKWNSKHLVKIDTFYPSSKLCNICKYRNTDLKLLDRNWTCSQCDTIHDRDINASINIKNEGFRLLSLPKTLKKTKQKIVNEVNN